MGMNKTIDFYREMLPINKHALDDELMAQAHVLEEIGQHVTELEHQAAQLAEQARRSEASAFIGNKSQGDSDKVAGERAKVDGLRATTIDELGNVKREAEAWAKLHDAWRTRGIAISGLVNLFQAGYFSPTPGHSIDRRERPARKDYSKPEAAPAPTPRRRVT